MPEPDLILILKMLEQARDERHEMLIVQQATRDDIRVLTAIMQGTQNAIKRIEDRLDRFHQRLAKLENIAP